MEREGSLVADQVHRRVETFHVQCGRQVLALLPNPHDLCPLRTTWLTVIAVAEAIFVSLAKDSPPGPIQTFALIFACARPSG